jgi:UDP-N-acetylglucosamine 4-epimerase
VQANLLAATAVDFSTLNQVYNVAVSGRTTLNSLFLALKKELGVNGVSYAKEPIYRDFRDGDVRHSQADIGKIKNSLGYEPLYFIEQGVAKAMPWYIAFLK